MILYASFLYLLIFALTLGYKTYLYKPLSTNPISQSIQASRSSPKQQSNSLYIISGEVAVITVVGALEVKFKFIRRFLAWLNIHKKAFFILTLIVIGAVVVYIAYLLGIIIAAIMVGLFFLAFIIPSDFTKSFAISLFLFLPLAYIAITTPLGYYGIPLYLALAAIGGYLLARHKGKNVFNVLGGIMCASVAIWFGLLLKPYILIILLVVLAVYDYITVLRTKSMQLMAGTMLGKIPVAMVIGDEDYVKKRIESVKAPDGKPPNPKEEKKGVLLGNGDLAFPSALSASLIFVNKPYIATLAMVGAIIGVTLNIELLKVKKANGAPIFQQGLPAIPVICACMLICIGAGFLVTMI